MRTNSSQVAPPTEARGVCCPTKFLQLRKQVVVAVTMDWTVMCFNHNLKLLWEYNLQHDFPHHSAVREVQHSAPSAPEWSSSHRLCVLNPFDPQTAALPHTGGGAGDQPHGEPG
jgi:hypothetical protein